MTRENRPGNYAGPVDALLSTQGQLIPDSWRPSPQLCQRLQQQGLNLHWLNGELRIRFVTELQQQGVRKGDWDQLFERYALAHSQPPGAQGNAAPPAFQSAASTGQSMSDDWRPSNEMVKLILATICPNRDYLKAQLVSFTSHFHGQYNPNWDQQFKKWINNGWNVYGHRNNFNNASQDQRGFVEKHTDKSWREGL